MSFNFESDTECVVVDLILLNGEKKDNISICTNALVSEEKHRILHEYNIIEPDLKLVIVAQNGSEMVMDEDEEMSKYVSTLAGSNLEIRRRNSPTRSSGYSENLSLLKCHIKQAPDN
ncbi:uncharacterized protein LOC131936566 [Physella acuta]|uniref:uncharacterized protein LOC131936566 n=1 Tax=Physella acuta TaxID=109671 RepID=UPI0027DE4BF6|nr:uncharacterized protein LOC131936566 [Physella acuta]XP_059149591.1 uncharacterized protein LOC131936566 [Physella acuta]XP_059149592.1 uncharacterized protein LOC131936566 [Physella acuta]XP_059149593.1 uncharacterized protein LOC131936566 [Physella acuta]XP_059149594.1 uncharacterized protein LOC131936566 [Physella acuta]XP_059149595.1 uncharacterized protein LOC131936566 [Physella acuta]XP_059149596.1 uncharacterized protein LOC131936566 [Physella acuta]XP_059149598.1 uncharacterized p